MTGGDQQFQQRAALMSVGPSQQLAETLKVGGLLPLSIVGRTSLLFTVVCVSSTNESN